ncbi:MAG TPA: hypothetical protein VKB50_13980 [Vicinamibacterales bacterium]|nr:hypothetical protein [Vicinamibacterales bacterium]
MLTASETRISKDRTDLRQQDRTDPRQSEIAPIRVRRIAPTIVSEKSMLHS